MFPGTILMGAQARLLDPSLPFRFFITSALFHIAVWVAMFLGADSVSEFIGGFGLPLTAIHLLTLGVFVMTAFGASFQLLTVATGAAHRRLWMLKTAWWLYLPGVLALTYGFAFSEHLFQALGALLTILALLLYITIVADILRRTQSLRIPLAHAWVALAALVALMALGFALIADYEHAFFPDHGAAALAHMILAVFGFMGMLAFGFSHILVPMFALSPATPEGLGGASFEVTVGALVIAVLGALIGSDSLLLLAIALGLVGAGMHIRCVTWALNNGMRKNLGLSFVMIRAAWVMLPITLLVGAIAVIGTGGENIVTLFGFLALFGWLLTFLMGIMQRIIPFLASMNMNKIGKKPPRLSEMASERPLMVNAVCHGFAVGIISLGIVLNQTILIQVGAISGVIGAFGFLWFALAIVKSYRQYHLSSQEEADS